MSLHAKPPTANGRATSANIFVYCCVHRHCISHGAVSLGTHVLKLQPNIHRYLLQKPAFVKGLDVVAAVTVKCHRLLSACHCRLIPSAFSLLPLSPPVSLHLLTFENVIAASTNPACITLHLEVSELRERGNSNYISRTLLSLALRALAENKDLKKTVAGDAVAWLIWVI